MTILVDMDDTIWGLITAWTEYLRKMYGVNVTEEDIEEWDLRKVYPMLTEDQIYAPLFKEDMWESVKPFQDAIYYLKKLIAEGHDVLLVTSSHYKSIKIKFDTLLFRHFPFIPYENVIVTSRKQMIVGDVMVDDLPKNLIGGKYKGILFEACHNRKFNEKKYGMKRAKSWKEVYEIIEEMSNDELNSLIANL